jgi:hypothetical protein
MSSVHEKRMYSKCNASIDFEAFIDSDHYLEKKDTQIKNVFDEKTIE